MNHLIKFARKLRKESTDAERLLWQHLRARRFSGFKFRRQQSIGPYIVDFICYEKKLIIECDGGHHLENAKDLSRDQWFSSQGYRVLRYWNSDILLNPMDVLESVHRECMDHPPSDSLPSREGEK
ncbi:MAG: endonuclease domain-containing protein [Proteobacteria bacterium]|nr:endonuclease domain-containing protein [Pseudomonadota bacterium]